MAQIFVLRRSTMLLFGILLVAIVLGTLFIRTYFANETAMATKQTAEYHVAVVEYESATKEGKKYDVYRFDPGTIYAKQGQQVTLKFHGVHGAEHPFVIEGYNIQDVIRKGETKSVTFHADKPGTFRIICTTHNEHTNHVPMIGYLIVD